MGKHGLGRNKLTSASVWPWLLLIVITNVTASRSCRLLILNGNFFLEVVIENQRRNTIFPTFSPVITLVFIIKSYISLIWNLVLFISPPVGSMFPSNIMGTCFELLEIVQTYNNINKKYKDQNWCLVDETQVCSSVCLNTELFQALLIQQPDQSHLQGDIKHNPIR